MSSYPYHDTPHYENNHRIGSPIITDMGKTPKFYHVLKPVLLMECFFGQCYLSTSFLAMFTVKILFLFIFVFLSFVFCLAVFNRQGIEIWVQFSLYIIPLLTFVCGAYVFSSSSYYRLLKRNLTSSVSVRFYVNNNGGIDDDEISQASAHNVAWLRLISIKSIVYPFLLETLQWGTFLIFFLTGYGEGQSDFMNSFVGSVKIFKKHPKIWTGLYIINWILSVYIVGFVSYQFVFVTRLIVKDTVNLMSLFGKSSYLKLYPVYHFHLEKNICFRICAALLNFLTMDLFNSFGDERIYTECAEISRLDNPPSIPSYPFSPQRVIATPFDGSAARHNKAPIDFLTPDGGITEENSVGKEDQHGDNDEGNMFKNKISPSEACEIFSTFIAEVESLTSVFMPFTILLVFFSVANLITHVGLFIRDDEKDLNAWTLFRTVLFISVALRMIVCVTVVSSVIRKLPAHVNLINTAGKLGFKDHKSPCWKDFLDLLESYRLGQRSFGFPMTIRQIASFVTALNMGFLIIFSVMNDKDEEK